MINWDENIITEMGELVNGMHGKNIERRVETSYGADSNLSW